jgi:hypothetical protein
VSLSVPQIKLFLKICLYETSKITLSDGRFVKSAYRNIKVLCSVLKTRFIVVSVILNALKAKYKFNIKRNEVLKDI